MTSTHKSHDMSKPLPSNAKNILMPKISYLIHRFFRVFPPQKTKQIAQYIFKQWPNVATLVGKYIFIYFFFPEDSIITPFSKINKQIRIFWQLFRGSGFTGLTLSFYTRIPQKLVLQTSRILKLSHLNERNDKC